MANSRTPKHVKDRFARNLRNLMAARKMTQSDVARELEQFMPEDLRRGPNEAPRRDSVSHWCRGTSIPWDHTFVALCRALRCAPTELLPSTQLEHAKHKAVLEIVPGEGGAHVVIDYVVPNSIAKQIQQLFADRHAW